jgi:hypothetical protein
MLKITSLALFAACSSLAHAESKLTPQVLQEMQPPAIVAQDEPSADGIATQLPAETLQELKDWARLDLRSLLKSALSEAETAEDGMQAALVHLRNAVHNVLQMSGNRRTSLLSRFALNRGLKLYELLDTILTSRPAPGIQQQKLLVLTSSIHLALKYYESEMEFYNNKVRQKPDSILDQSYQRFGLDFARMLISVNESLINAKAQYQTMRLILGFLLVDFTRDVARRDLFAQPILELYLVTKEFPEDPEARFSDAELIQMMRKMRKAYFRLLQGIVEIDKTLKDALEEHKNEPFETAAEDERTFIREELGNESFGDYLLQHGPQFKYGALSVANAATAWQIAKAGAIHMHFYVLLLKAMLVHADALKVAEAAKSGVIEPGAHGLYYRLISGKTKFGCGPYTYDYSKPNRPSIEQSQAFQAARAAQSREIDGNYYWLLVTTTSACHAQAFEKAKTTEAAKEAPK